MSPEVPSFAAPLVDASPEATRLRGVTRWSWRHLATLLLLLVTLPVFALGALAALPLAIVGALVEAVRRTWTSALPRRAQR